MLAWSWQPVRNVRRRDTLFCNADRHKRGQDVFSDGTTRYAAIRPAFTDSSATPP
jgi:hypothetical protein